MTSCIYLDHNATTPLDPRVLDKMIQVLGAIGNPSSIHTYGRQVRSRVEAARLSLGQKLGVPADRLFFTSGGTESNNMILGTFAQKPVIVAATEHDCVFHVHAHKAVVPVLSTGLVDLNALRKMLSAAGQSGGLLSVMLANNETGVIQPIAAVAALAHEFGWYMHTDACQALGKIPVNLKELGVDYASFSAHKFGGPSGVGLVYAREKAPLEPLVLGGGQERGRRSGMLNPALAVGFAEALETCDPEAWARLENLRDDLIHKLKALDPDVRVLGEGAHRLPNTVCVTMPGVSQETQVLAFDLAGIAVSAGAACSSGKMDVSRVLLAMGLTESEASTAIRVSMAPTTTGEEITQFLTQWREIFNRSANLTQQLRKG